MPGLRCANWWWHTDIPQGIAAVHLRAVGRRPYEWLAHTLVYGDIAAPCRFQDHQRVARAVRDGAIAIDSGQGFDVQLWGRQGQENGRGIVNTRVSVDDDAL